MNSMYIFYDLETSGLNQNFSQIFQIAMVFADDELNMLSSKDLKSRRLPWVVPSPGAMLITGFTADDLKKAPMSHFEMMAETNKWVRSQHWPLTFIGYNSLGFDEPVLRQNLHQTLHDPYLSTGRKSWGDEPNKRADVFNMVQATFLYAPGTLKLKEKTPSGRPSLSLGNVARQNGVNLSEEEAHDALADVKATIGVAKVIKAAAPEIWKQMMSLTTPKGVDDFLKNTPIFAHSQRWYGDYKSSLMTPVADREGYGTEHTAFDLSFDPAKYMDLSVDELAELMKVRGDESFDQPLRSIRKNTHPVLMPLDMADPIRTKDMPDDKTLKARADMVANNKDFQKKIAKAAAKAHPFDNAGQVQEIEQMIFEFPDKSVRKELDQWMADFRAGDWDQKFELVKEFPKQFEWAIKKQPPLKRFVQFGQRILFADAPDKMSAEKYEAYAAGIHKRLTNENDDVGYMTLNKARAELAEIETLRADGDEKWAHVTDTEIRSLKLYYTAMEKEFATATPKKPTADPAARKPDNAESSNEAKPPFMQRLKEQFKGSGDSSNDNSKPEKPRTPKNNCKHCSKPK